MPTELDKYRISNIQFREAPKKKRQIEREPDWLWLWEFFNRQTINAYLLGHFHLMLHILMTYGMNMLQTISNCMESFYWNVSLSRLCTHLIETIEGFDLSNCLLLSRTRITANAKHSFSTLFDITTIHLLLQFRQKTTIVSIRLHCDPS